MISVFDSIMFLALGVILFYIGFKLVDIECPVAVYPLGFGAMFVLFGFIGLYQQLL